MKTSIVYVEKVPLIVPLNPNNNVVPIPPAKTIDGFESYCGPGQGIGDLLVPETFYGLRVSAACWAHDLSFEYAEPKEEDFIEANFYFWCNLSSIIRQKTSSKMLYYLRILRANTYYQAVEIGGESLFWKLKKEQQEKKSNV